MEIQKLIQTLTEEIKNLNVNNQLRCYTVEQVAEILEASKNTVYKLIEDGLLIAFQVGRNESKKPTLRVTKEALENYIISNSVKGIATNESEVNYGFK